MSGDRPKPEGGRRQLIREAGHGIREPQGRPRAPEKRSLIQKIWADAQKGNLPEPTSEGPRGKGKINPNLARNLMGLDCHGASPLKFLIQMGDANKAKEDEPSSASISISDITSGKK